MFNLNEEEVKSVTRTINEVVIHHTAVTNEKQPSFDKQISSMQNSHKVRFPTNPDSTNPDSPTNYVQYAFVVGQNGEIRQTRSLQSYGYHASNLPVNRKSLGVCMTGNFDKEVLGDKQRETTKDVIQAIKKHFKIDVVSFHRDYTTTKMCPGTKVSKNMFEENVSVSEMEKYSILETIEQMQIMYHNYDELKEVCHNAANAIREVGRKCGISEEELKKGLF